MNYQQLQSRALALAKLEGWTDTSPAPDWPTLVQRGWNQFAWDSECVVATETLGGVSGQTEYSLAGTYKAILDVTYNAVGLLRSEERYERSVSASWRNQAAGTPLRWCLTGFGKISLLPPPNGTLPIVVRGIGYGTQLSAQTDSPPVPDLFHEAIALKAVIFQGQMYAMGDGAGRLASMDTLYLKYVSDCREALLFGFERRQEAAQ